MYVLYVLYVRQCAPFQLAFVTKLYSFRLPSHLLAILFAYFSIHSFVFFFFFFFWCRRLNYLLWALMYYVKRERERKKRQCLVYIWSSNDESNCTFQFVIKMSETTTKLLFQYYIGWMDGTCNSRNSVTAPSDDMHAISIIIIIIIIWYNKAGHNDWIVVKVWPCHISMQPTNFQSNKK